MWAALELELGAAPQSPNSSMLKGYFSSSAAKGWSLIPGLQDG